MNICICCRSTLLRHIRQGSSYWFCPQCYQAMPRAELETGYSPYGESDRAEGLPQTFETIAARLQAQTSLEDSVKA